MFAFRDHRLLEKIGDVIGDRRNLEIHKHAHNKADSENGHQQVPDFKDHAPARVSRVHVKRLLQDCSARSFFVILGYDVSGAIQLLSPDQLTRSTHKASPSRWRSYRITCAMARLHTTGVPI